MNPCTGGGGGGFGGFGGGGAATQAPHVMPGKYNVSLVSAGKVLDTKPITVIMDPAVKMTMAERAQYNTIVTDLHSMHERGSKIAGALGAMNPQMRTIDSTLNARNDVPAAVKTQFAALKREFDALAPRFGIGGAAPPAGGGGGGRGGGGGADTSVYGRAVGLKGQIMNIWELPGEGLSKQYADIRVALSRTIAEGNAFLTRAAALSTSLARHGIALTVPPR